MCNSEGSCKENYHGDRGEQTLSHKPHSTMCIERGFSRPWGRMLSTVRAPFFLNLLYRHCQQHPIAHQLKIIHVHAHLEVMKTGKRKGIKHLEANPLKKIESPPSMKFYHHWSSQKIHVELETVHHLRGCWKQ